MQPYAAILMIVVIIPSYVGYLYRPIAALSGRHVTHDVSACQTCCAS